MRLDRQAAEDEEAEDLEDEPAGLLGDDGGGWIGIAAGDLEEAGPFPSETPTAGASAQKCSVSVAPFSK